MKHSFLPLCAVLLGLASSAPAQVLLSTSGTYSQNFDALPATGTSNTWTDNLTLVGWYADKEIGGDVSVIAAGTGSSTTTNLYSFGTTSADRALGALSSGTSGAFAYGVVFQNISGEEITFTNFSYRGELWRMGSPAEAETLEFAYQLSSSAITSALSGTWTNLSTFNFTNPNPANPAVTGAIDGNLAGNFTSFNSALNLTLSAGGYLMFRWYDADHNGADNGLAVDDVAISYVVNAPVITAVPEPSTYGFAGIGCLALATMARRLRRTHDAC